MSHINSLHNNFMSQIITLKIWITGFWPGEFDKNGTFLGEIIVTTNTVTVHATISERFSAAPIRAGWSRVGGDYTITYYRARRGRRCTLNVRSFRYCGIHCSTIYFTNNSDNMRLALNRHENGLIKICRKFGGKLGKGSIPI